MKIYNPTGFSSSLTGSFSGSVKGTFEGSFSGNVLNSISGAFTQDSSSFASRIDDLETFEANIDSTYATDGDVTAVSNRVGTLEGKTLLSSSAQIANDISGSFTQLSSSVASTYLLNTTDTLTGDLTVTGTITAQEFHTEFVSASIIYQSGSTQFGNSSDDTHVFTGNVGIGTTTVSYPLHVSSSNYTMVGVLSDYIITNFQDIVTIENRTMTANKNLSFNIGKTGSTNNLGKLVYKHVSDGSTDNLLGLGFFDNDFILNVVATGRVGIGTTSPSAKLHVDNTAADAIIRLTKGSSTIGNIDFVNEGNRFSIQDDGTRRLVIDSSGNVGIGTDTPTEKLDVVGNIKGQTARFTSNFGHSFGDTAQAGGRGLSILNSTLSNQTYYLTLGKAESTYNQGEISFTHVSDGSASNSLRLGLYSNPDNVVIQANGIVYFPNGSVGIGTTNPTSKLSIYTDSDSQLHIFNAGTNATGIKAGSGQELYIGGNDTWAFRAQSNGNVTFDNGGSVGIGTGAPNSTLHVFGNLSSNPLTFEGNSSSNAWVRFKAGSTASTWQIGATSGAFQFYDELNTSTRLVINSNGNLGVGTTTPNDKLHIKVASGDAGLQLNAATQTLRLDQNSIRTITNSSLAIFTNNTVTNGVYIEAGGDVGIGTATPGVKLDVAGDVRVGGFSPSSSTTNYETVLRVKGKNNYSDGTTWYGDYGQIILDANSNMTGGARKYMITNALDNTKFAIIRSVDASTDPLVNSTSTGVNSGTADFVINSSGEVGIGTETPAGKLDVYGDIYVNGTQSYPVVAVDRRHISNGSTTVSTGASYTDIGPSISYTPKQTGNIIMVFHGCQTWYGSSSNGSGDILVRFLVNGTEVWENSRATGNFDADSTRQHLYLNSIFTFTASNTSAHTIKFQAYPSGTVVGGMNFYHTSGDANQFIFVEYQV